MAFIPLLVLYYMDSEEEIERKSNLGQEPRMEEGEIRINTMHICSYNETDKSHVICRMTNGDILELPMPVETFEALLAQSEVILNFSELSDN
jgi:hypothetical protein